MIPVLYMDDHIVVCVKPSGVVSQEAGENSMPALLRAQLKTDYIAVVHRLDREVGGVMVYALNRQSASHLSNAMQSHDFEKKYLAVLCGSPSPEEGILEDLLFHDKARNKSYIAGRERKGVKSAKLSYRLLGEMQNHSLVQVHLHTGRTHQIRVQFASRKLPLTGDRKYGGDSGAMGLWAFSLTFPHPATGETMHFMQMPPNEHPWNCFDLTEVAHVLR